MGGACHFHQAPTVVYDRSRRCGKVGVLAEDMASARPETMLSGPTRMADPRRYASVCQAQAKADDPGWVGLKPRLASVSRCCTPTPSTAYRPPCRPSVSRGNSSTRRCVPGVARAQKARAFNRQHEVNCEARAGGADQPAARAGPADREILRASPHRRRSSLRPTPTLPGDAAAHIIDFAVGSGPPSCISPPSCLKLTCRSKGA